MKRRFPTGKNEYYDQQYMRLKNESQVLAGPSFVGSVHNQIFDESGLLAYKNMLTGEGTSEKEQDEDEEAAVEIGSAIPFTGKIPRVKRQLREFDKKVRSMQIDDVLQGKEVRAPKQMPVKLLEEQLLLFARLDIYLLELEKVTEKLDALKEVEQVADDHMVLAYGLICTGQLFNSQLNEIDSQTVEKYQGILIIKDERSPYNGMSVVDYRQLAKDWQEERAELDRKHLIVLQEVARKENKVVPRSYTSVTGYMRIPKAYLPPWPEGITNYLETVPKRRRRTA